MVSVVIPTIKGREAWLETCVAAYETTCPGAEVVIIRDRASCGEAWIEGAAKATGQYLHFTADDLVPQPGWWQAAVEVADAGGIPAANVLTAKGPQGWLPDSTMWSPVAFVSDEETRNILVPFLSREQFELGDWLLPIHYGSDDWVTFLAERRGILTPYTPEYLFTHGAAPEGRLDQSRYRDMPILCEHMAKHGRVPFIYRNLAMTWGWTEAA
jgi:hypothetical protein